MRARGVWARGVTNASKAADDAGVRETALERSWTPLELSKMPLDSKPLDSKPLDSKRAI